MFYLQNTASPGPQGPPPGQPRPNGPDNINALQKAIDTMEEKGMQDDQRYSQLLALRARSAGNNVINQHQMTQLRNQIIAYRYLARSQALPPQVAMAIHGKRPDGCPTPPASPYPPQGGPPQQGEPPTGDVGESAGPMPPGQCPAQGPQVLLPIHIHNIELNYNFSGC